MKRFACLISLSLAAPHAAAALSLDLPIDGRLTAQQSDSGTRHALPVAAWRDGTLPTRSIEGDVTQSAYRLGASDLTTGQMTERLRDQLAQDGYEVVFSCSAAQCGGYDFRFAADILPAPAMQVDLGDFTYLSAVKDGEDGPQAIGLVVSRTVHAGYVQVTEIGPAGEAEPAVVTTTKSSPTTETAAPAEDTPLTERLVAQGRVPLDDLTFATGSTALNQGSYGSLDALAAFLDDNPERDVVLVGHTDTEGSLSANIDLSRRRAEAVRTRLTDSYGIDADRIRAEGVGYLAPRTTNDTESGRLANRRVEIVLGDSG
ncbi:OmpA-OmpF porin, OOP family [Tranquillimonas rosea]|uniref:OmpA-OmpF porin, OOP family n=1 Tax=Tranquillimonas rosea TaxID=641238 RepID=A0A1H9W3N1_9RHOB|nr:OmpA family protein [Tranquillimonas rosea]SES28550.1 OmpA-OmpF porin, OOP family [Tranquillimonas rosea]